MPAPSEWHHCVHWPRSSALFVPCCYVQRSVEKKAMRQRLGGYYSGQGATTYGTLKYALHEALDDPVWAAAAGAPSALWLEFGVFGGLSINITTKYRDKLPVGGGVPLVHGFDTFTGLPSAWKSGKGTFFKRSAFSWAAKGLGRLPPVRKGVQLHVGLFNETLPPFMAQRPSGCVVWSNIDCDLYVGARDALGQIGGRLCPHARLHLHEVIKHWSWVAKRFEAGTADTLIPSDETRALWEWLRTEAGAKAALELSPVKSKSNSDAAFFVVRR